MFACVFETNFPNIPLLKPKLLSVLAAYFSSVVFVFFSWCMFLPSCLYVAIFLFYFYVFVLFLVSLSVYEKKTLFSL